MKRSSISFIISLYLAIIYSGLYFLSFIGKMIGNIKYYSFLSSVAFSFFIIIFIVSFIDYRGYTIKSILGLDEHHLEKIKKKYYKALDNEDYLLANKYHKLLVKKENLKKILKYD